MLRAEQLQRTGLSQKWLESFYKLDTHSLNILQICRVSVLQGNSKAENRITICWSLIWNSSFSCIRNLCVISSSRWHQSNNILIEMEFTEGTIYGQHCNPDWRGSSTGCFNSYVWQITPVPHWGSCFNISTQDKFPPPKLPLFFPTVHFWTKARDQHRTVQTQQTSGGAEITTGNTQNHLQTLPPHQTCVNNGNLWHFCYTICRVHRVEGIRWARNPLRSIPISS